MSPSPPQRRNTSPSPPPPFILCPICPLSLELPNLGPLPPSPTFSRVFVRRIDSDLHLRLGGPAMVPGAVDCVPLSAHRPACAVYTPGSAGSGGCRYPRYGSLGVLCHHAELLHALEECVWFTYPRGRREPRRHCAGTISACARAQCMRGAAPGCGGLRGEGEVRWIPRTICPAFCRAERWAVGGLLLHTQLHPRWDCVSRVGPGIHGFFDSPTIVGPAAPSVSAVPAPTTRGSRPIAPCKEIEPQWLRSF